MKKEFSIGWLAALALILWSCGGTGSPEQRGELAPGLIVHNGKIFTANEAHDFVEAVAVWGGEIVAAGSNLHILELASAETRLMDLQGHTMLPGFHDNHIHLGRSRGGLQEWKGGLISTVPGSNVTSAYLPPVIRLK